MNGLLRKSELIHYLPSGYDAFLFLDSDTIVLEEISFGFEMALKHGIAMAPCHHYGLENFWGFREVMKAAGQPQRGQLQYNTGVLFFRNSPDVLTVLKRWNRSEEHTSELQSRGHLVCRLLLEKKKKKFYDL